MIKTNKAFTLLEIIVVMFIMAISIGVIGLSVSGLQAKNDLQPFVDLLYQRMNNFEQEAALKNIEIGVNIFTNKIEVLNHDHGKDDANNLEKLSNWEVKRVLSVPNNIVLKYEVVEPQVFISDKPDIIFSSGGFITPFKLTIGHLLDDYYYVITSQFSGELSVEMRRCSVNNTNDSNGDKISKPEIS